MGDGGSGHSITLLGRTLIPSIVPFGISGNMRQGYRVQNSNNDLAFVRNGNGLWQATVSRGNYMGVIVRASGSLDLQESIRRYYEWEHRVYG